MKLMDVDLLTMFELPNCSRARYFGHRKTSRLRRSFNTLKRPSKKMQQQPKVSFLFHFSYYNPCISGERVPVFYNHKSHGTSSSEISCSLLTCMIHLFLFQMGFPITAGSTFYIHIKYAYGCVVGQSEREAGKLEPGYFFLLLFFLTA